MNRFAQHDHATLCVTDTVICRAGITADAGRALPRHPTAGAADGLWVGVRTPVRWSGLLVAVSSLTVLLAYLPNRTAIPPLIESDYCYLLIAADRFHEGLGLTSLQPVAPGQSWNWAYDWGFLTQWPIGYPLLISTFRSIFGGTTIQACQWISILGCATALVGWYVWVRRTLPRGLTGAVTAAACSGCAVTTAMLINPTTDLLLVAAMPIVLLLVDDGMRRLNDSSFPSLPAHTISPFLIAGLLCGGLFWIRYASVFLPGAITLYLLLECIRRRKVRLRYLWIFAISVAVPIVILLWINRAYGTPLSIQEQLNLGRSREVRFSFASIVQAWWTYTNLGFYDHLWYSRWILAISPVLGVLAAFAIPSTRRLVREFLAHSSIRLAVCTLAALFIMLVAATTFFGDKFSYVGLDRYYQPVKPLYFVLLIGPLLLARRRWVRIGVFAAMLSVCSWTVRQEWARPYHRWLAAQREVTPYGQWANCLDPGAGELYSWLSSQVDPQLIVVSNFHEYIALETGMPALPVPADRQTLERWTAEIKQSRGLFSTKVYFVLDGDPRWRGHWVPPTEEIVDRFGLTDRFQLPEHVGALIYPYRPETISTEGSTQSSVVRSSS